MTTQTPRWVFFVGAAVLFCLLLAAAFGLGRCSAPEPPTPVVVDGVDAGPGEAEIAARLDAAVQAEEARLEELERKYAEEIRDFSAADRREYEETRARGRDALAAWLKERSRRLLERSAE